MAIGLTSYRPLIGGATHMISTGHYLATAAGYRILEQGGNAIDAGVAAGIVINVTLPQYTSFGGVAPIIIHHAASGETREISGLGRWPAEASIDYFIREHGGDMPHGVMRTVTPAAVDAWITSLSRYGTMTFEQVVTPALELAAGGFPVPASLHRALVSSGDNVILDEGDTSQWASTMQIFYPGGKPLGIGDLLVQSDLARTFQRLIDIERASAGQGREAGLQAARDLFYQGEIAEEMVAFIRGQGGWLSMQDLADFSVGVNVPPMIDYKGPDSAKIDVYACGPWCQGPMNLHALRILEGCDLQGMGHNSADYIHTVLEALKLAFSDRHAYYGDPDFVDVPMDGLLSREYANLRRREIDPNRANPEMPDAGNPWAHQAGTGRAASKPEPVAGPLSADTSYICAVDRWGNAFSATPSDGFGGAPIAPGLGFMVSARGAQNWLDEDHPSSLAPGKRPRLTPNPAMAFKDGKPWLPFGTPGGDVQPQSMVQLFLNIVEFGMDVQRAIEAPRASTWSFPNSFFPHAYRPGLVGIESRIDSGRGRRTPQARPRRGRVERMDPKDGFPVSYRNRPGTGHPLGRRRPSARRLCNGTVEYRFYTDRQELQDLRSPIPNFSPSMGGVLSCVGSNGYIAVQPPSMTNSLPVMKDASSEARNSTPHDCRLTAYHCRICNFV